MDFEILGGDDEVILVNTVTAYFEMEGYGGRTAFDVSAADHEARASRPELVVLDIMLPDRDSLEVHRQLRWETRDMRLRVVYAIVLTAD
jgi:two-component system OmpR family response regulator